MAKTLYVLTERGVIASGTPDASGNVDRAISPLLADLLAWAKAGGKGWDDLDGDFNGYRLISSDPDAWRKHFSEESG